MLKNSNLTRISTKKQVIKLKKEYIKYKKRKKLSKSIKKTWLKGLIHKLNSTFKPDKTNKKRNVSESNTFVMSSIKINANDNKFNKDKKLYFNKKVNHFWIY